MITITENYNKMLAVLADKENQNFKLGAKEWPILNNPKEAEVERQMIEIMDWLMANPAAVKIKSEYYQDAMMDLPDTEKIIPLLKQYISKNCLLRTYSILICFAVLQSNTKEEIVDAAINIMKHSHHYPNLPVIYKEFLDILDLLGYLVDDPEVSKRLRKLYALAIVDTQLKDVKSDMVFTTEILKKVFTMILGNHFTRFHKKNFWNKILEKYPVVGKDKEFVKWVEKLTKY